MIWGPLRKLGLVLLISTSLVLTASAGPAEGSSSPSSPSQTTATIGCGGALARVALLATMLFVGCTIGSPTFREGTVEPIFNHEKYDPDEERTAGLAWVNEQLATPPRHDIDRLSLLMKGVSLAWGSVPSEYRQSQWKKPFFWQTKRMHVAPEVLLWGWDADPELAIRRDFWRWEIRAGFLEKLSKREQELLFTSLKRLMDEGARRFPNKIPARGISFEIDFKGPSKWEGSRVHLSMEALTANPDDWQEIFVAYPFDPKTQP